MMIESRLKKCCFNCPHSDIETKPYTRQHVCDEYPTKDTIIFCKHEPVCKMYHEETEAAANENTCTDN